MTAKTLTREFLSTGQAAALCLVTPDTVLKWIKSGRIPANRTPGGHYRIRRSTLLSLLETDATPRRPRDTDNGRSFKYCWEFNSLPGNVKEGCQDCIVYRSGTSRCYEIRRLPTDVGHARLFCEDTCDECEYYKTVHDQRSNILVITNRPDLQGRLETEKKYFECNLRFTDCEYQCSMIVETFRPDYVIIDCSLGSMRSREFARHMNEDPRIPYVRVILVGNRDELPRECDKMVFAFIERPFTTIKLANLIHDLQKRPEGGGINSSIGLD